ncbi:hypothetical protein M758_6G066700 [Ceratodon purpureus]|nr:hypothetical protein M758_6G066700 [Ceratodon purpureus]
MVDATSSFVVSLIENRAKEVGIAAFDLRTAKLHLSQFIETSRSYQNTATLLQYFDPADIITPANLIESQGIIGLMTVVNQCASASKVTLSRGCFDDTKGAILVQSLVLNETLNTTLEASYKEYYLCLGAAAALFRWIDHEKGITLANRSVEVTLNGSFDHMNIDGTSVRNLELVESLHIQVGPQKKRGCLFEMLKTTKTVGGTRLLRASLLQPLKDKNTINTRLDCLDELTSDDQIFFGISQALQKFPKDIDRILCSFCFKTKVTKDSSSKLTTRAGQSMVNSIILLKEALDRLPSLQEALQDAKCSLLSNIRDICSNESFRLLLQSNALQLKVALTAILMLHVKSFVQQVKLSRERFAASFYAFNIQSELINRIREDLRLLTSLSESLALLDMMVNSFVNLISTKPAESYIRPEFTETGPIAIEKGRHPVLEGTIAEEFVANNAFISEASNTMIVTGPNMSGKSTYLRQVVLITIMAHIGCYVPARFASFRIVDHIFTRIGTSDNIELNSSTFMTEMRETAYLLNNLTSRSLVVVDELGRATSTGDGFAIAWSCCEYMLSFKA